MELSDHRYHQLRNAGIWINERTGGEKGQPLCARLCQLALEESRFGRWAMLKMDAIHEKHLGDTQYHCWRSLLEFRGFKDEQAG